EKQYRQTFRPACGFRGELACSHQRAKTAGAFRSAELAQRLGFDLADALARDIELLADFFQGVLALAADTEPHPDYFLLFRRKGLEDARGFIANVAFDDR